MDHRWKGADGANTAQRDGADTAQREGRILPGTAASDREDEEAAELHKVVVGERAQQVGLRVRRHTAEHGPDVVVLLRCLHENVHNVILIQY